MTERTLTQSCALFELHRNPFGVAVRFYEMRQRQIRMAARRARIRLFFFSWRSAVKNFLVATGLYRKLSGPSFRRPIPPPRRP